MICENCGAEYNKNNLKCPYCNSENLKAAGKLKEQILEKYDREAQEMAESIPKKAVRNWTKYIIWGMLIFLSIIVVITIFAFVGGRISAVFRHSQEQRQMERLEELFQAQDWEEMSKYIDDNDIYNRIFAKYTQVNSVWKNYCYYKEAMEDIGQGEMSLIYISDVLQEAKMAIEDKALMGNEYVLKNIYNESVDMLLKMGFSQEEIEEITIGQKSSHWEEIVVKFNDYIRK